MFISVLYLIKYNRNIGREGYTCTCKNIYIGVTVGGAEEFILQLNIDIDTGGQ